MNLRISDFCHFIEDGNDFVALYNSLTLGVVIVKKQVADVLIQNGNILSTETLNFLVHKEKEMVLKELQKHKLYFPLGKRPDLEDYIKIQQGCHRYGCASIGSTD